MTTQVRKSGQTAILVVEGKLSIGAAVDEFRDRWNDAVAEGAHDIIVDLSRVPIIDSSAIGSLIRRMCCTSRLRSRTACSRRKHAIASSTLIAVLARDSRMLCGCSQIPAPLTLPECWLNAVPAG